jgi:hypothetical protein
MRRVVVFVMACLLIVGCVGPTLTRRVSIETRRANEWVSAEELDQIAREYARQQRVDFDFDRLTPFVFVRRSGNVLAMLVYGESIGRPTLMVEIGHDLRVIRHTRGVGRCGHDVVVPVSEQTTPADLVR